MSLLRRRLNVFDLTLITIGSIIGSGIFKNPALVANRAHLPVLAIGCWVVGGAIALIGAFVFAELAERRPVNGGIYAYLRDAYHPVVAFVFGWTLLLIADTGGTAAAAVLFAGAGGRLVPVVELGPAITHLTDFRSAWRFPEDVAQPTPLGPCCTVSLICRDCSDFCVALLRSVLDDVHMSRWLERRNVVQFAVIMWVSATTGGR